MFNQKEYAKQYRLKHKEERKIYWRQYFLKNKKSIDLRNKKWRENNQEHITAQTKLRREQNPERTKVSYLSAYFKTKRKHPLKYNARRYIRYAVEREKIQPAKELLCKDCGNQAQEYHHHKGYEKEYWLDVIPLCVKCHRRVANGQKKA